MNELPYLVSIAMCALIFECLLIALDVDKTFSLLKVLNKSLDFIVFERMQRLNVDRRQCSMPQLFTNICID